MNAGRTAKATPVWPSLRVKLVCQESGHKYAFLRRLNLTAHGMAVVVVVVLVVVITVAAWNIIALQT